ncbi:MAG: sodium:proton antiporter NhaD [Alloprevotella sp.]|nr:sodium:proton antiporter NhaD [Alloprevotella sp.]
MSIYILLLFLIGVVLISTEQIHRANKAAVAMFIGVLCWIVYLCFGTDFVTAEHGQDFRDLMAADGATIGGVKDYIAQHLFLNYFIQAANLVLFLIATMTIVEVLDNNGCFDFLQRLLYTRSPRRFLWVTAIVTFLLSANLDNLTTACLMLAVSHSLIPEGRLRFAFGCAIVLAANCGGAFTVIGDTTSLALWNSGLVEPTLYAARLALPCLAVFVVTTWLIQRSLPRTMRTSRYTLPYRGDDTRLNYTQRIILFVVGIGGLWFIPTFHRITHLPAFLGALCVLAFLWIVNEISNRHLIGTDYMVRKRQPQALQHQNLQNILFVIGLTLMIGAVEESGFFRDLCGWVDTHTHSAYLVGTCAGVLSAFSNNVAIVFTSMQTFSHSTAEFAQPGGQLWPLLSYCTAIGGTLLPFGTLAGFALWRIEGVTLRWYVAHFLPKLLAGALCGGVVFWICNTLL